MNIRTPVILHSIPIILRTLCFTALPLSSRLYASQHSHYPPHFMLHSTSSSPYTLLSYIIIPHTLSFTQYALQHSQYPPHIIHHSSPSIFHRAPIILHQQPNYPSPEFPLSFMGIHINPSQTPIATHARSPLSSLLLPRTNAI